MNKVFSFGSAIGWTLILIVVAFYGIIGQYAPYAILVLALIATPYLIHVRAGRPLVPDLPGSGWLISFGLLIVAFSVTAHKPSDVLIVANFLWLPLFIPVQSLLKRLAGPGAPVVFARLVLLGVVLLILFAGYERFSLAENRVGQLTSDPIRIANTAAIMGSLSLVGLLAERSRWRLVYLAGPVLAFGVAYLAGTRGAMASIAVVTIVAVLLLIRNRRLALLAAAGLTLTATAGFLVAAQLHVPRIDSFVSTIEQILRGETVTDGSAQIRIGMQRAALSAFQDSPWFGYGWQRIMAAATSHLPSGQEHLFDGQPHLHSDIANFAVAGGLVGLLAYATLLLTPLVAAWRSARDGLYRIRLVGISILTASYAGLGLNSLMFGFEVHTALFCCIAAILLGLFRETSSIQTDAPTPTTAMSLHRGRVERIAVWSLLILALAASTTIGLVTPYLIVLIGIATWFVLLLTGRLPESYGPLANRLFLVAFAVLAVDFTLSAKGSGDLLFAFNFTMFFLFGPIAFLFARAASPSSMRRVAALATAGVVITFLTIVYFQLTHPGRPYGINLGPIVLSNAVLALAVLATMAGLGMRGRLSLLLPLTLAVAVATTILTQSRGPLLAVPFLIVFTIVSFWLVRFRGSKLFLLAVVVLVAIGGLGVALLARDRVAELPRILGALLGGGEIADRTTSIRLALYEAGWQSFIQSPWIGHGWARLMSSTMPFVPPEFLEDTKHLPQLHNDVLNFAVAGGLVGVGVYFLVLTTPLVAALRSARDSLWAARVYGTGGLAIVYAGGGLTDLMFGHEFHTAMFVVLNAIILGYCRDAPADRSALASTP